MIRTWYRFIVILVLISVGLCGSLFLKKRRRHAALPEPPSEAAMETTEPRTDPPPSFEARPDKQASNTAERAARLELLQAIAAAREDKSRRLAAAGEPAAPPALDATEAGKAYIKKQLHETLVPLVRDCYENALVSDPTLGGRMLLQFVISGEPELGGLVESASIDEAKSTLKDSSMIECVRENSYALRFPPPRNGGSIAVNLPLVFKISAGAPESEPPDSEASP